MRSVGVEEEFLLVDAHDGRPVSVATEVIRIAAIRGETGDGTVGGTVRGALVNEFLEQQVEAYTSPHRSMVALETELRAWRDRASLAAGEAGAWLLASATSPVVGVPCHVRLERYDRIAERFGIITRDQMVCGCHVHVSISSLEEGVGVLDRIRGWLPALLALSANSPFWQGQDTGYASFRHQALERWPVSGATDVFGSAGHYREVVDDLVAADVILDEQMVYFDARCSHRYRTVEIRMPDVCVDVRDAIMLAALCRALVDTAAQEWAAKDPPAAIPTAVLRLATWHAAKSGIGDRLLDPQSSRPRPAEEVVRLLLKHVHPALCRNHDDALVGRGVDRILTRGTGARLQRGVMRRTGRLVDVVTVLADATIAGH